MSRTLFSTADSTFSLNAHTFAQSQIYAFLWPGKTVTMVDATISREASGLIEGKLDGEMGIDRIALVSSDGLRLPIKYTIQERFRRESFKRWGDITMTEWNNASNTPSELYKIQADLFVYGYFDSIDGIFKEFIVVYVPVLKTALSNGLLKFVRRRNNKNQDFLGISIADLERVGAIMYLKT